MKKKLIRDIIEEIKNNRKLIKNTVENIVNEEKTTEEELEKTFKSITGPVKDLQKPLEKIKGFHNNQIEESQSQSKILQNISRKVDAFPIFHPAIQNKSLLSQEFEDDVFEASPQNRSASYNPDKDIDLNVLEAFTLLKPSDLMREPE